MNHQQTADSSPLIISPMMSTHSPHPISHQAQSFSFICPQHIMKSWWKLDLYAKDKGHCPQTKSLIRSCCEFQSCSSAGDTGWTFLVGLFRLHLNCKLQIVTQQHRFKYLSPKLFHHKHTSCTEGLQFWNCKETINSKTIWDSDRALRVMPE